MPIDYADSRGQIDARGGGMSYVFDTLEICLGMVPSFSPNFLESTQKETKEYFLLAKVRSASSLAAIDGNKFQ